MASAKSGVHVVQLKPISVPKNLIDGCKFVKWDDDTGLGIPVILKVDRKGFFLYWTDQNGDTEFLEISSIRDTRTGKYARTPKAEGKIRDTINIGPMDVNLEDKTMTVVYGPDFVNVNFINFCTYSKEIAQEWTGEIFKIAYNLLAINASVYTFLEKAHTKLCLMTDRDRKLPVKNILKMFASHKDDRKRVEKALELCSLSSAKHEVILLDKFDMSTFFNFYKQLIGRNEVLEIFDRICRNGDHHQHHHGQNQNLSTDGSKKAMTVEQFVQFLNREQRDPRLNEILYPYANRTRGLDLIEQYEPDKAFAQKGLLSFDGFLLYLMSDDNAIIPSEKFDLNCDMDQPLSHYFINSSHNTYLTGHQFTGKSSVEIYRQCLLGGCRCIELDCWNGRSDDEPIITHGYTVVTEVSLKEVLEAIAESAFKTSHYPVILSFENHCSNKQQLTKMARYCRQIFGDMLLTEPLPTHPLKPGVPLPSPNQLLKKIIIKDKKEHKHNRRKNKNQQQPSPQPPQQTATMLVPSEEGTNHLTLSPDNKIRPENSMVSMIGSSSTTIINNNDLELSPMNDNCHSNETTTNANKSQQQNVFATSCDIDEPMIETDSNNSSDDDDANEESQSINDLPIVPGKQDSSTLSSSSSSTMTTNTIMAASSTMHNNNGSNQQQQHLVHHHNHHHHHHHHHKSEMSELVIYVQPIQFRAFDIAEKRNRSFEVSSFDENESTGLLKEQPVDFVNYNKRQLSRIYPKGTRVNSSNFLPQVFWNSGCQMVALNFQTLDLGMQLNLGIFEYNGRNGYLLKPDFMRRQDRRFDPFTESTVDGIIAGTVSIKIISGQFLSDKRVGTYVEVDMYGLPADTVRRKRTKIIPNNALNPIYDEEPFVFKKVVLPDLACLRIAAFEDNGKFIGTRILPFVGLRPGYRHISLRNESLLPLTLPTLFVHITVKDYIPDGLSELADALANPIAYQSMVEKHAKQLLALIDEGDEALMAADDSTYDNQSMTTTTTNRSNIAASYSMDTKSIGGDDSASGTIQSTPTLTGSSGSISGRHAAMMNRQMSQAEICLKHHHHQHSLMKSGSGIIGDNVGSSTSSQSPSSISMNMNNRMELNGATNPSKVSLACGSPTHKMSLMRQDTLNRKMASIKLHDDVNLEKSSLLESNKALLEPVTVEKLKLTKNVQKTFAKVERDIINLQKKYDKIREKLKETYLQEEERAIQCSDTKPQKKTSNSLSKSVKKIGSKKQYNNDIKLTENELKIKLQELQKTFSTNILNSFVEQYKDELKVFESRYEQLCLALDKAMDESQQSQKQYLNNLHDKEVASLMKRLDGQNKEELQLLSKSHKDKNELARIKRELQQKLIDQAVYERQRLRQLLDKRELELTEKHKKEERKLLDEKKRMLSEKQRQCQDNCDKIQAQYELNPDLFLQKFNLNNAVNKSTSHK